MTLKRRLNLFDATLLIVGNVAGAGIFTTSGFLAGRLPDPWLFIAAWVAGGLLTVCGALTYAEMSAMFPRSGGDYHFLNAAYGPWAGFLLGWVSLWVINPGSIAVLAIAVVKYLAGLTGFHGDPGEKAMAVAVVALFSLLNYRGVRHTGTAQNLWTLGSMALLMVLIAGGLMSDKGDWAHFTRTAGVPVPLFSMFGPAMIAVIFAYSGWFVSAYVGDEVVKPERTLPMSIFLGTAVVMLLYILVNVVYLYAMPVHEMKDHIDVGGAASRKLLSPWAAKAVSVAVILTIGSGINATVLAGARLFYAMAKDGFLPQPLAALHRKNGTPHRAIAAQGVMASIFVVVGTFEGLLSSVVVVMLLSSIASGAAHLILRRRMPHAPRPYRTWGAPLVPLVFIVAYSWIGGQIIFTSPWKSILGLAVTATGIPFYILARRRAR